MSYQSVNPYNGKTIQSFEEIDNKQLEAAIAKASACFEIWSKKSFAERAVIVAKAAVLMEDRLEEFAKPVTLEMGKLIASRIDSGMVFINHPTWTSPDLPFGGIKNSGYGRELSSMGIQEFVNKKLVRVVPIDAEA